MSTPTGPESWPGDRAARWVAVADRLEGQLAPVTDLLFAAAELAPGEAVLDVGCGTGPTTRHAAQLVGPTGSVTGVDISPEMLDAARHQTAGDDGSAPIEWIESDVAEWNAGEARFDAVISRFGVMFFADPHAAFARLARATIDGGRLRAAVWAHRPDIELFDLPLTIALDELRRAGITVEAPAPDAGPYSLGDAAQVEQLLTGAGWSDVSWQPHEMRFRLGGGAGPVDAAAISLEFGPARIVLEGVDDAVRRSVADALTAAYEQHLEDGEVVLGGRLGIVAARRSSTA
jgi:SAM-dependent methyltransferase